MLPILIAFHKEDPLIISARGLIKHKQPFLYATVNSVSAQAAAGSKFPPFCNSPARLCIRKGWEPILKMKKAFRKLVTS